MIRNQQQFTKQERPQTVGRGETQRAQNLNGADLYATYSLLWVLSCKHTIKM